MVPRNPKILVVAEEESVQKLLEDRLVSEGFRVMQAFTWNKAVDFFAAEKPDAIILDIDFGGDDSQLSGPDLIHFIKKFRNYPAPLIVYGEPPGGINSGLDAGAITFVPKSAPVEELASTLLGMLGSKTPHL